MRLWHKELIPYLPKQQLLGQWRECCLIAKQIAEKGTPNHILVNKVIEYPLTHFHYYASCVSDEMEKRGYRCDFSRFNKWIHLDENHCSYSILFANWHNERYLIQCLYNLQEKADSNGIPREEWEKITEHWEAFK